MEIPARDRAAEGMAGGDEEGGGGGGGGVGGSDKQDESGSPLSPSQFFDTDSIGSCTRFCTPALVCLCSMWFLIIKIILEESFTRVHTRVPCMCTNSSPST